MIFNITKEADDFLRKEYENEIGKEIRFFIRQKA